MNSSIFKKIVASSSVIALFIATAASAMTISGGAASSTIYSGSGSVPLSDIQISCTHDSDISTPNLIMTISFVASNGVPGNNPLIFDADATSQVHVGQPADNTGEILSPPVAVGTGQLKFVVAKSCKAGDTFTISGVRVKPNIGNPDEGTAHVYLQSGSGVQFDSGTSSSIIGVDTRPPRLVSGEVTSSTSPANGIADRLTLHFSEPVLYGSLNSSHWSIQKINMNGTTIGDLTLQSIMSPQGSSATTYIFGVTPGSGSVATTRGQWSIKALPGNSMHDPAGNTIETSNYITVNDAIHPMVRSVSPGPNTGQVNANTPIVINFSEEMDPNVTKARTFPSSSFLPAWSSNHETLTLTPTTQQLNTVYTVSLEGASISGEPLEQTVSANGVTLPWHYTTGNSFASDNGTILVPPPPLPSPPRPLPTGLSGGMLVKRAGYTAVYYVGADGYRYVFPNQKIFLSWYTNQQLKVTSEGGQIVIIDDDTMASMPIGGNVTYRPGVRMIKIESDPKVYVVDHGGILRWVSTPDLAVAFYGPGWAGYVDDLNVAFFPNYGFGTNIVSTDQYNPVTAKNNSPTIQADKGFSSF